MKENNAVKAQLLDDYLTKIFIKFIDDINYNDLLVSREVFMAAFITIFLSEEVVTKDEDLKLLKKYSFYFLKIVIAKLYAGILCNENINQKEFVLNCDFNYLNPDNIDDYIDAIAYFYFAVKRNDIYAVDNDNLVRVRKINPLYHERKL